MVKARIKHEIVILFLSMVKYIIQIIGGVIHKTDSKVEEPVELENKTFVGGKPLSLLVCMK